MSVHPFRRLAKAITAASASGTPIRHARGVVVSSTVGQTTLTLDGGATDIAAFNYGHTQSLAAGTVVDALLVGAKAYVLGAYGSAAQPLPAGTLLDYAGGTVPTGYLLCDGSAVSRSSYAALFTAIGTGWGAGNGTTTFNVPDIRGRVSIGAGSGAGLSARTLAQTGGEETNSHTHGSAAHSHSLTPGTAWAQVGFGGSPVFLEQNRISESYSANIRVSVTTGANTPTTSTDASGVAGNTDSATPGSTGAPSDTSNMAPFAVVTKIIKT